MTYPIQPGPFFTGDRKFGKLPNPLSLAGERRPVQTSHWPFLNSSSLAGQRHPVQTSHCGSRIAEAAWTHRGKPSNLWIPCKESQLNIN